MSGWKKSGGGAAQGCVPEVVAFLVTIIAVITALMQ
jgi:hypothetical protein